MFKSPVFAHRGFKNLFIGQFISMVGDGFFFVSFAFMLGKISGRSETVGFNFALELLPFLLLGPYAGVLADRLDRRKIVLLSDIGCGLILTVFALWVLVTTPPIPAFYTMSFLIGVVRSFFHPAKSAAIPRLVPADQLQAANGVMLSAQSTGPIFGLFLTSTALTALYTFSPTWFFFLALGLNAFSFWLSAAYMALLPSLVPEQTEEKHPMTDLKEGLAYIHGRKDLLSYTCLSLLVGLGISPFFVFYAEANRLWFGNKPSGIAICEGTFLLGMVIMSSQFSKFKIVRPGLSWAASIVVVGIGIALMAFSKPLPLFVLWNFLCGLGLPFAQIPFNTYLMASTPDTMRGRVNSVVSMVNMGIQPIGLALGGIMLAATGLQNGFLIMGIALLVTGAVAALTKAFAEVKAIDQ